MKRTRRGFTLVELIVVIAILGILAGVAIPVYSGYIRKANQAADETLLGSVNTAFGAACMENKIFNLKTANGAIETTGTEGHLKIATVTASPTTAADEPAVIDLTESFMKYFKGNENSEFKVFTAFVYDTVNGGFKGVLPDGSTAAMSVIRPGYTWNETHVETARTAFVNSSFWTMTDNGENLGKLTGTVDNLAGALSDNLALKQLKEQPNFVAMCDTLGIDPASADNTTLANAAVFFVADKLSGLDAAAVQNAMKLDAITGQSSNLNTYLTNNGIDPVSKEGLFVSTALKYGVATAYVNSSFAGSVEKAAINGVTPTGLDSALTIIQGATSGTGYKSYLASTDTSGKDMGAFFNVLAVLKDNTDGFENLGSSDLFSNPDVLEVIQGFLTGVD